MKILIIDDDADFRALVSLRLREWLDCSCDEFDPRASGAPPADFEWSAYDCVLLDHELGNGETGIEWLKRGVVPSDGPPILYITGTGDEYLAVRAVKLGVEDYMKKIDFSGPRLAQMIRSVVGDDAKAAEGATRSNSTSAPPKIDGYRIYSLVGQGATSSVYLGERKRDRITVVLKIMRPEISISSDAAKRFAREAEIIATIRSPHVVRVFDHGFVGARGYMVMEFLPRGDLKQRIAQGLVSADAHGCLVNIALGLDTIHTHSVVHRDLKPANVMFRWDDTLVIADFGLSRRIEELGGLTSYGRVLGTPFYMSPEQAQAEAVDARCDLYGAGAMFFEMLTGKRPYTADSITGLIYQHVHAAIPRLPDEHARFQPIIDLTMAKRPEDRFADAKELLNALAALEPED